MDIKLNYVDKGRGESLILLHGNGEDSSYFANQIEYFSRDYRVIAPDTRGHGLSPRGSEKFSLKTFARDLADFTEEMGIHRSVILGFSDGANIAMEFALAYPERVSALILNGGNLHPQGVKARYQIPIEIQYRWFSLFSGPSRRARKKAELMGLMVKEPHMEPEKLRNIKVPVLVICGTRDMIKESHTELIARSIPQSRLVLIPGDHFIAGKCPEKFNEEVEKFLREINSEGK